MDKSIKNDVIAFFKGDGFSIGDPSGTTEFRLPNLREFLLNKGHSMEDIDTQMSDIVDTFRFKVLQGGLDHIMSCDISDFLKK